MSLVTLVNGEPGGLGPADRGLAYGDGLFETMACRAGRIRWLDAHFDRLYEGCARLAIPAPRRAELESDIRRALGDTRDAVVKLTVTRGESARGYRPAKPSVPTRIVSIGAWPNVPAAHYSDGITVRTCTLRLGENPQLAGLKHLCRLEQVLAQMELTEPHIHEGLLRSRSGRVVSGISCNAFIVRDGRLMTPRIDLCGVRGVMRRVVLEHARGAGIDALEAPLEPADFAGADELFFTNAVLGIRPVRALDGRAFEVGPVTRQLQGLLGSGTDA